MILRILPRSSGFTLIELLIVIGLLGGLAMLVLPQFQVQRTELLVGSLAPAEMMDICRAFAEFEADCVPASADRTLIERSGLEILMEFDAARGWTFPASYGYDRGKGWRGPYIEKQGDRKINSISGQPLLVGGVDIPVVHDPYNKSSTDEHYYRVIHTIESGKNYLKLVFVGSDDALGTADDAERVLLIW